MTSRTADVGIRLELKDGNLVEQGLAKVGTKGKEALDKIKRSSTPASKGLIALSQASRSVQGQMESLAGRAGAAGRSMSAMGPAGLAAAAGIGAMVLALGAAMNQARLAVERLDQLEDAATSADFGVERLQELRFAAEQTGVTVQQLEDGLRRMTRRIGLFAQDGGGPAAKAFEQLGISVVTAEGNLRSSEAIFDEVVQKLEQVESQAIRSALASQIFGDDAGPRLTLLLNQGADGVRELSDQARELGLVLDEAMVLRGSEAADQLKKLDNQIQNNLTRAFEGVAPVIIWVREQVVSFTGALADTIERIRELVTAIREYAGIADTAPSERVRPSQSVANSQSAAPAASSGRDEVDKIQDTIDALRFQREQLDRTNLARKLASELQRAGIDASHAEAQTIADLVVEIENLTEAQKKEQQTRKRAEAITKSTRTALEEYGDTVAELAQLQKEGLIDEEARYRATEAASQKLDEAFHSQLDASREAADGVQRALRDIREASSDLAAAWDRDISGMNSTFRSNFVAIVSDGRNASEALDNIFNDLLGRIAGRVYDNAVGGLVDSILGGFLHNFSTGSVRALVRHDGGFANDNGPSRMVSPLAFAGAPRLHGGGFANDEVPTILQRGERVLTEAQQANTAQTIAQLAAMSARSEPSVTVNVVNPQSEPEVQTSRDQDGGLRVDVVFKDFENRLARNVSDGRGPLSATLRAGGLSQVGRR